MIERTEGILTGVAGSEPEGVWIPGGGIEFPCKYVLYGAKKYRKIVNQTPKSTKVKKTEKKKTEIRIYVCPTVYCLV